MKAAIFLVLLAILLTSAVAYSQILPKPVNYMSDFAGVVDPDYESLINQFSQAVEKNTSSQIFVATVEDTSPYTSKEYATKLFEEWKPGQKGKDNGIIVLLAFKPDRRVEIETGYGMEGILPDSKIARIAREYSPLLTESKYGEGLYKIVQAVGGVIQGSGEFEADGGSGGLDIGSLVFLSIIIIFVAITLLGIRSAPKCPTCKTRMKKASSSVDGEYIIEEFVCKTCGKKTKKKRARSGYYGFIFLGGSGGWGGGSGGGFGGGGGGSSGGGGGGSGF